MPKKFVGETFGFSRISGVEKFLCISGVCHDFLPAVFCRTVPKTFLTEPFVFQISSGMEKDLWIRRVGWGEYHDFFSEISCRTVR